MNIYFVVRASGEPAGNWTDLERAQQMAQECANVDGAAATILDGGLVEVAETIYPD